MTEPIDWSLFLPPHPLSDSGPKQFKAGQVWAVRTATGEPYVIRVINVDGVFAQNELLAGKYWAERIADGSMAALHSVCVQDTDEPTPRDVRVLYTEVRADGYPATCLWCGGPKATGQYYGCGCPQRGADILVLSHAWDRIRMSKPAPVTPVSVAPNEYAFFPGTCASEPAGAPHLRGYPSAPATTQPGARLTTATDLAYESPRETAAKVATLPKCGNSRCKTPFQNVAQRWCQSVDRLFNKTQPVLEWSCEPCHLLDEAEWMKRTNGVVEPPPQRTLPYSPAALRASLNLGPARLDGLKVRGVR